MQNQEYYRRYEEIFELLCQCYMDRYILTELDNYNELVKRGEKALPKASLQVLIHCGDLAKTDLGLLLWKLTDHKGSSNTIVTLNSYLRKEHGKQSHITLSDKSKHIRDYELRSIRNHALAHNDLAKTGASIQISSLFEMLEDVRQVFNSLCYQDVDNRVTALSNSQTYSIAFSAQLGLHWLMENSLVSQESAEEMLKNDI